MDFEKRYGVGERAPAIECNAIEKIKLGI